jgi:hypothetical protein
MVINLWNGRCPSFQQTHLYIGVLFFVVSQDPLAPFHISDTLPGVPIRDHEGLIVDEMGKLDGYPLVN